MAAGLKTQMEAVSLTEKAIQPMSADAGGIPNLAPSVSLTEKAIQPMSADAGGIPNLAHGRSRTGRRRKQKGLVRRHPDTTPPIDINPVWSVDFWHPDRPVGAAPRLSLGQLQEKIPIRFNPRLQQMIETCYDCRNGLRNHRLKLKKQYPDATDAHIEELMAEKDIKAASNERKCPRCWMVPEHCFCELFTPLPDTECPFSVSVYIHWKEASKRKASNTAKLVPMLLPGGSLVPCGDVEAEAALFALMESQPAAILYPSPDALEIGDWIKSIGAKAKSSDSNKTGSDIASDGVKPTIVVLDGTWNDVKFLNKAIPPSVPRVKLTKVPEWLSDIRTRWAHPEKANVQSFNAIIAALDEGGLSADYVHFLTDKLREATAFFSKQTFPEKCYKAKLTRESNHALKQGYPELSFKERSQAMAEAAGFHKENSGS